MLARAELDNKTNYNDEEMCPDLMEERAARGHVSTAVITPNPARDYCQVILENPRDAQVQLYNVQGKILRSRKVSGSTIVPLDIADLASGIYLIEVRSSSGIEMYKLFVTH